MKDAVIKTERAAAAAYNGMACEFLREVEESDAAFTEKRPQIVVLIDGREVYFYGDEVVPVKKSMAAAPEPAPAPAAAGAEKQPTVEAAPSATETQKPGEPAPKAPDTTQG